MKRLLRPSVRALRMWLAHARVALHRLKSGSGRGEVLPLTDFPQAPPPSVVYVICATPRSGSNLLCEALWRTGLMGRPIEYFLPWTNIHRLETARLAPFLVPPEAFLQAIMTEGSTSNGVFGVKVMWEQMGTVIAGLKTLTSLRGIPDHAVLSTFWPGLHYIYLTRRDKVRQTVSWARAMGSRKWTERDQAVDLPPGDLDLARRFPRLSRAWRGSLKPAGPGPVPVDLKYSFSRLKTLHDRLCEHDEAWEGYFRGSGIQPIRVIYEDFAADSYAAAVAIGRRLGVSDIADSPPVPGALRSQSDSVNDDWASRFRKELEGHA